MLPKLLWWTCRLRFSLVVGDKNGHVGFGTGKAQEVPEAIRKSYEDAKKILMKATTDRNSLTKATG